MTTTSKFIESLKTVRQEIHAGLASVGMYQPGLELHLPEGVQVPAEHCDGGIWGLGPVEPGNYEIHRLDSTAKGRVAVLLKLPARTDRSGPELYDECFVFVAMSELRKFQEVRS